jgi:hypothetical protein
LRECLGKGVSEPITQQKLSEIIGVPTNTIRAFEAKQRKLPDHVILEVALATGADWETQKKRWIRFNSNPPEPFKRHHYNEFKKRSMQRPVKADALAKDLLKKMYRLFIVAPDSYWLDLYFRFRLFVAATRKDFQAAQLEEIYLMSAEYYKVEGAELDPLYQEQLGNNRLQKEGWERDLRKSDRLAARALAKRRNRSLP